MLLSFKGARHELPESHPAHPRNHLPLIHNGRDVVMATYCAFETVDCGTGMTLRARVIGNQVSCVWHGVLCLCSRVWYC